MRLAKHIVLGIFIIVFVHIMIDNYVNISEIKKKENIDYLRVGYVNLNKSKVSKADLTKIEHYACDIWLFAEWNGDNFELYESFSNPYTNSYELTDSFTYGFHVLTKDSIEAREFDSNKRPYACDYSKVMINNDSLTIALIHAPPPVPTCKFETRKYLSDLMDNMDEENKNVLIVGDFNILPFQDSYKKIIDSGFNDLFENSLFTANSYGIKSYLPKMIRVDYMFYRGSLSVKYAERFKLDNSDHYGLIADYMLK